MLMITKRLSNITKDYEKAKRLAGEGKIAESNDFYITAYMEAADLLESYAAGYFSDDEYIFINKLMKEFENQDDE